MKKIFLVLIVALANAASAQVNFVTTTDLNLLLKQARQENKFVFIDAYTDWCVWCKELDKKVFATPEIGEIMSKHFIATKMEMEQDSIGVMLARKYAVRGFPTAIILNGNGELINFIDGYSELWDYAKRMITAIDPSKRIPEGAYSRSFNIGYPEFYAGMMPLQGEKKQRPDSAVINSYFQSQQDFSEEQNWVALMTCYFWLDDGQFERLLKQGNVIANRYGREAYEQVVERMIGSRISKCTKSKDLACVESYLAILEKQVKDGNSKKSYYIENYYEKNAMWSQLAYNITQGLKDSAYAARDNNLNERAWTIYEKCDDKKVLEQAALWMKTVVKTNPKYMYVDTYAALLYKTNRLAEARSYAKQAIDIGKKNGDDVSGTEKLLKKIDAAK